MKTSFKQLSMLCLFGNFLPTQAVSEFPLEKRSLQQSGPNCRVSGTVTCTVNETGQLCQLIGQQPFGTCGLKDMTFEYKFCNLNENANVLPVARAPASGQVGTEAMFRQNEGFPELNLASMGPGVCRTKKLVERIDTCKKRVVGSLRFEGWVEGNIDIPGFYCYAYDFLNVEFRQAAKPENPPTPAPVPTPVADISLELNCFYTRGGLRYNCESLEFKNLPFYSCAVPVTYVYKIVNQGTGTVFLDALLDVDFVPLVGEGATLAQGKVKEIPVDGSLNLCEKGGSILDQRALAFATPKNGGITDEARDNLQIEVPLLPFKVMLEGISCEIADDTSIDCNEYLGSITNPATQCRVNVQFKYTVTNVGLACVDISHALAGLGPLGERKLAFEDFYPCGDDRKFCDGDSWTIPDRRSINICTESQKQGRNWMLDLAIKDSLGRIKSSTVTYPWVLYNTPLNPATPAPAPSGGGNSGPTKGKNKNKRRY